MFVSLHPCLFDLVYSRFTCSINCQIWFIHIPNLFPFSTTCYPLSPIFSQFFPVCLPFSYVVFSCLLRCSAFSRPFPACSSIFEPFSSIFHFQAPFPAAFSHHFPAIFRNIPSLSTVCFPHRPGLHTLPAGPAARWAPGRSAPSGTGGGEAGEGEGWGVAFYSAKKRGYKGW